MGINLTVLHVIHKRTTQKSSSGLDRTTLHMKLDTACLCFFPTHEMGDGVGQKYHGEEHF